MRHNNAGRRLGRKTSHRIAMFRNMLTSFLDKEKITTTDAKAKELRSIAEKMITLGKRGDLHAMRQSAAYIRDKKVVTKLFTTIAPRYKERPGGYTRIVKLGIRLGDNAPLSMIELVEEQMELKPVAKSAAKKTPGEGAVTKAGTRTITAQDETATASLQVEAPVSEVPSASVKEGDAESQVKTE
jgi:large subunit ribosomal protein L17